MPSEKSNKIEILKTGEMIVRSDASIRKGTKAKASKIVMKKLKESLEIMTEAMKLSGVSVQEAVAALTVTGAQINMIRSMQVTRTEEHTSVEREITECNSYSITPGRGWDDSASQDVIQDIRRGMEGIRGDQLIMDDPIDNSYLLLKTGKNGKPIRNLIW